jgi:hypothetical protein
MDWMTHLSEIRDENVLSSKNVAHIQDKINNQPCSRYERIVFRDLGRWWKNRNSTFLNACCFPVLHHHHVVLKGSYVTRDWVKFVVVMGYVNVVSAVFLTLCSGENFV